MKGLNIKRIAAIGLGAALVGSALAPVVSAANVVPTGLDELGRDTVITATGAPAVDIVVGANASVSDVVWAGNIAARVAQLATKPVTCTAEAGTVDFTIGGKTTLIGEGREQKIFFPGSFDMTVDNGKTSSLINETDWEYEVEDKDYTTKVVESIFANVDINRQTDPDGLYAGQIIGAVENEGQIGYRVTFDAGLPFVNDNNDFDMTIPLFGKTWEVRSIEPGKVVLGSDRVPTKVYVNESIKVQGRGEYAGKELDLTLTEVARSNVTSAKEFLADFVLYDGSTAIASKRGFADGKNVQEDATFKDYFSTPVTIEVVREGEGNKRYVDLQIGEGARLTLENGKEFKDDGNDKTKKWVVKLTEIPTETPTTLTKIEIVNGKDYTYKLGDAASSKLQGSGKDQFRMGPMVAGTEVDIADEGKYVYVFRGGTTETMYTSRIADSVLTTIIDSQSRDIPLWFGPFQQGYDEVVEIAGRTFTVYGVEDGNVIKIFNKSNVDEPEVDGFDFSVDIAEGFSDSNVVSFDIDYGSISDVNYQVIAYRSGNKLDYFLALDANQTLGVDLDLGVANTATIDLNRSFIDTNAGAKEVSYYAIPTNKMPKAISNNYVVDGNAGLATSSDADLSIAEFVLGDRPRTSASQEPIVAYVDVKSGNLKDSDKEYVQFDAEPQAEINDAIELDATDEDKLVETVTSWGTEVSVADSELVWSIPEKQIQYVSYLGSSDLSESSTGGKSYKDVSAKETRENVRIDAVNCGAGSSSAVEIVPVSNLVKTAKGSGKSIIVGGWVANAAAANLEISAGNSLDKLLLNSGDYVAAVLASGDIVVAGFNGNDTGRAAQDLITALEGLM